MSLAQRERQAVTRLRPGPTCNFEKALAMLDQEDADALTRLIYKRLDLTGQEVETILAEEDVDRREAGEPMLGISAYSINRHRRGVCANCAERG